MKRAIGRAGAVTLLALGVLLVGKYRDRDPGRFASGELGGHVEVGPGLRGEYLGEPERVVAREAGMQGERLDTMALE